MPHCPTCLQPKPVPAGMRVKCPLCHSICETDIALRGLNLTRLSDSLVVRLTALEASLLAGLEDATGVARREFLIERMYPPPRDEPKNASHSLTLAVLNLRKKIIVFGWEIQSSQSFGYTLVKS